MPETTNALSLSFQYPLYLLGLAACPVLIILFVFVLRWKKHAMRKIGDERLVRTLISSYSPRHFLLKFALVAIALAAIITAWANLRKPGQMADIHRRGVDVMIALDVSKSMLAEDIKPNRLERARELVYHLLDELKDDRIGLVLFAGRAYMQMPLTTDHGAARMFVQSATPDVVPTQGTVIGDALKMCLNAFDSHEKKYKTIVLITDGEDHDPEAPTLAKQLAQNAVIINAVGIGSADGAPITDPATGSYKKDDMGQTIISRLNETELKQLASDTRGVYVHYTDTKSAVEAIMNQLNSIQQNNYNDNAFRDYKYYFQWFLGFALVLVLLEFVFPERAWKSVS